MLWRLDQPEPVHRRRGADSPPDLSADRKILGVSAGPRLAELLRRRPVRPNAVTLASATLMLLAAGLIAAGLPAGSVARPSRRRWPLALVLDTADGRLARLQGTSSAFGRWLDQFLDEMADMALHAAIAWSAFARDGRPAWLLVGIIYASGKYLFLAQSTLGDELERRSSTAGVGRSGPTAGCDRPRGIAA